MNETAENTEMNEPEVIGDILKNDGSEFQTNPALLAAITKRNCIDTHAALKTKTPGWIGVPIGDPRLEAVEPEAPKPVKKKLYPVRVRRISGDEANRDLIIKVTANGPTERAIFKPGEDVHLTETQINILNDSVIDSRIELEETSGIYSARQPEVAAKNMYPGFQVTRDPQTGRIVLTQHIPNYSIEYLGERP